MQRRPQSERWAPGVAQMVGGVPWHMSEEDEDADGPSVKGQLGERKPESEVARVAATEAAICRMNITKADLEKYRFTAGCLGCMAWLTGRAWQGHSEEYSRRFEEERTSRRRSARTNS